MDPGWTPNDNNNARETITTSDDENVDTLLVHNTVPSLLPADTSATSLQLTSRGLTSLDEGLLRFTRLSRLMLSGNAIETIPDWITQLTTLKYIAFGSSSFGGNQLTPQSFPDTMSTMTSLRKLMFEGNHLPRPPAFVFELPRLGILFLPRVGLVKIPPDISRLRTLADLRVHDNKTLRHLPAALGALPRLTHLSAANCSLRQVPYELTQLSTLNLRGNPLMWVPAEELDGRRDIALMLQRGSATQADAMAAWFALTWILATASA